MEHIIQTIVEGKFKKVQAEAGYFLTNWKAEEGIKNFYASEEVYFPLEYDYEKEWRIITQEEYERFIDERDNIKINNEG